MEERTNYPLTLSVDDLGEEFGLNRAGGDGVDPQRICVMMYDGAGTGGEGAGEGRRNPVRDSGSVAAAEREADCWCTGTRRRRVSAGAVHP